MVRYYIQSLMPREPLSTFELEELPDTPDESRPRAKSPSSESSHLSLFFSPSRAHIIREIICRFTMNEMLVTYPSANRKFHRQLLTMPLHQ